MVRRNKRLIEKEGLKRRRRRRRFIYSPGPRDPR
jgi:predicted transcriptional regulator